MASVPGCESDCDRDLSALRFFAALFTVAKDWTLTSYVEKTKIVSVLRIWVSVGSTANDECMAQERLIQGRHARQERERCLGCSAAPPVLAVIPCVH